VVFIVVFCQGSDTELSFRVVIRELIRDRLVDSEEPLLFAAAGDSWPGLLARQIDRPAPPILTRKQSSGKRLSGKQRRAEISLKTGTSRENMRCHPTRNDLQATRCYERPARNRGGL